MTCIAVKLDSDGVPWMAGDRAVTGGCMTWALDEPKVWRAGDCLVGFAGELGAQQRWKRLWQEHESSLGREHGPRLSSARDIVCEQFEKRQQLMFPDNMCMVIACNGAIYDVDPGGCFVGIGRGYHALGNGAEVAIGAMMGVERGFEPEKANAAFLVRQAVQFACDLIDGCREPIDIVTLAPSVEKEP